MWFFFKYDFRGLVEGLNRVGWIAFFYYYLNTNHIIFML